MTDRTLKRIVLNLLILLGVSVFVTPSQAENFEGKYVVIDNPDPQYDYDDKISVMEIFWYGCPHCYQMEYHLTPWLKDKDDDVAYIRVPGVVNDKWQPLARVFFAARQLDVLNDIHLPLFHAIHRDKRSLTSDTEIKAFIEERGLDGDVFMKAFNSNDIQLVLEDIFEFTVNYRIASVPAFIINNKYITAPTLAGSYENVTEVIDHLIELERVAKSIQ
jgi:thiol:disulfide interchange protein DsbA